MILYGYYLDIIKNIYVRYLIYRLLGDVLVMKLPWNKKFIQIGMHIVVGIAVAYILILLINFAVFTIRDITLLSDYISSFISVVMKIFAPLVIALVMAYLLNPLVDFFQNKYDAIYNKIKNGHDELFINSRKKDKLQIDKKNKKNKPQFKRRTAGTIFTYISICLLFYLIFLLISSYFGNGSQDRSFSVRVTNLIETIIREIDEVLILATAKLDDWGFLDSVTDYIETIRMTILQQMPSIGTTIGTIISSATSIGNGVLSFFVFIINFIMALLLAFYIMRGKDQLIYTTKDVMETFLPNKVCKFIYTGVADFNSVFSGYIIGLTLDAIFMGTSVAIALSLINSEFAVFIGVMTGFSALIPFIGGIVAFFLAVGLELLLGNVQTALWAAILIIAIQQFDSMFVVPKLVGRKVKLSAPIVIIALLAAGKVFGVVGMFLVVPTSAVLKIFIQRFMERCKKKKGIIKKKEL